MPGWLIIILVLAGIGAVVGFFASFSEDNDLNPAQGFLSGLFGGGIAGMGCLAVILELILPFAIAIAILCWLF